MYNEEIKFSGNLKEIKITPYTNKHGEQHSRVDMKLVSDERINQTLLLSAMGSMGDQIAALNPQPGLCTITAYLSFSTFMYNQRDCQEVRAWKYEVVINGQLYVITKN